MSEETIHEKGREAVEKFREYLESTAKFRISFTVYQAAFAVEGITISGEHFHYDMVGKFVERPSALPIRVYIEVKSRYSSPTDLTTLYNEFVVKSFSFCLYHWKIRKNRDFKPYFLFLTNHPFHCAQYSEITNPGFISGIVGDAINKDKSFGVTKNDITWDEIGAFANLLWIIIFSNKQELLVINDRIELMDFLRRF